jgi:hypothetical protein
VRWLVCLFILLIAPQAGAAEPFVLDSGIVVDGAAGTVYIMTPARQVEALNGRTGGVVWTSTQAAYPLMAHGDSLLALDPGKALVLLDRRTGRETRRCTPTGVSLKEDNLRALHHQGATYVFWSGGRVRVDMTSCGVAHLGRKEMRKLAMPDANRARDTARAGPHTLDGITVELVSKTVDTQAVLTLHRTTTNGTKSSKELGRARLSLPFHVSADGRQVLVAEQLEEQNKAGEFQFRASLWDMIRGHRLAHFVTTEYLDRYAFIGGRLVARGTPDKRVVAGKVVPRGSRVRAIDLENGREVWARPVYEPGRR